MKICHLCLRSWFCFLQQNNLHICEALWFYKKYFSLFKSNSLHQMVLFKTFTLRKSPKYKTTPYLESLLKEEQEFIPFWQIRIRAREFVYACVQKRIKLREVDTHTHTHTLCNAANNFCRICRDVFQNMELYLDCCLYLAYFTHSNCADACAK